MDIKRLFKKIKLELLPNKYVIASISPKQFNRLDPKEFQKKFFSIICEKEGITLIINENNWNNIKNKFKSYKTEKNYKIITSNAALNWDAIGYLAAISKTLADNNISIGVVSTYLRDILLIKDKDAKKALKSLKELAK